MMRKRILSILQYVVFLGLGLFLLWYTTRNLSEEEIAMMKASLLDAKYLMILPAMFILLAAHYSRALRWKILMEPLGFQPSTLNTFFAVMLSYFFNLLVPRLGEVMKCTLLARYEKTPVDKLIGTMVAERAFDVICMLVVIFLTIVLQIDIVGEYASTELRKLFSGNINVGKVVILGAGLIILLWLARFILHRFAHISIIGKIKDIAKGIWEGLTSVMNVKRKTAFFLHSIFIWTMYLLSIRIGFYAMESVTHLGIKPAFTILSFGSLAMIVTQGGIGAYQLAVQKTLVLYDIAEVNGLAFGWLLWLVQTVMVLGVGLLCLFLLPIFNRKPHEGNVEDKGQDI
jgi:glycosyltransferase 2 family protein